MKIIIVCLILMSSMSAFSEDGRHLMERSEETTKSLTEKSLFKMDIFDQDKKLVQSRDMEFLYKHETDKEVSLIKFISPPILQGTGLLIEDRNNEANDIWLYLPATRKLRRVSGSEKTNWFMGTEFTHEDFEDYKIDLYKFSIVKETACGDSRCIVILAEPDNNHELEASGYSKKIYYIDIPSQYPVAIEYFDHSGELIKRLTASSIKREGNYWRPQVIKMENMVNKRVTQLTIKERALDITLDNYYVSSRYLRAD